MLIKATEKAALSLISKDKDPYLYQAIKSQIKESFCARRNLAVSDEERADIQRKAISFISRLAYTMIEDATGIPEPQNVYRYNSIIPRENLICIYSSVNNHSLNAASKAIQDMLDDRKGWFKDTFTDEEVDKYLNADYEEELGDQYEEEEDCEDFVEEYNNSKSSRPSLYFSTLIGTILQFENLTGNVYKVKGGYLVETESDLSEFLPCAIIDYKKELVAKVTEGKWNPVKSGID